MTELEQKFYNWMIDYENKTPNTADNYVYAIGKISAHFSNLHGKEVVDLFTLNDLALLEEISELYSLKGNQTEFGQVGNGTNRNAIATFVRMKRSKEYMNGEIDSSTSIHKRETQPLAKKSMRSKKKLYKYKDVFKMPNPVSIMGRSSSITNSFINGIIPVIEPSDKEIEEVLKIFGLSADDLRCVYCGDKSTEWDHLYPLIEDKEPTGYISEIQNLVPACGKCNQSKGNTHWEKWMFGNAKQSPFTRNIIDIEEKSKRIKIFEDWKKRTKLKFEEIVDSKIWKEYKDTYDEIIKSMEKCQEVSKNIKTIVEGEFDRTL